MRLFFDTSVLIPVFFEDHEHHEASLEVFLRADKDRGWCGAHSLAEFYATATRLPGKHRLSGEQVLLFLESVRERLRIVALNEEEYYATVQQAAASGIVGAAIYDALLVRCALKVEADTIYTWNVKHFQQVSPRAIKRIKTPLERTGRG